MFDYRPDEEMYLRSLARILEYMFNHWYTIPEFDWYRQTECQVFIITYTMEWSPTNMADFNFTSRYQELNLNPLQIVRRASFRERLNNSKCLMDDKINLCTHISLVHSSSRVWDAAAYVCKNVLLRNVKL